MATTLSCVTIDCVESGSLAEFWAAALGWDIVYNEPDGAALQQADGTTPMLYLQPVPEPKSGKNRAHVDLATADYDGDLRRLLELGATEVQTSSGPGGRRSIVLADPQGNEFCLTES
jgi:predicted enzyme related to lactoylglutathione lyase